LHWALRPNKSEKFFLREARRWRLSWSIGVVGGICFAKAMLRGLATVGVMPSARRAWLHVTGQTLVIGLVASWWFLYSDLWLDSLDNFTGQQLVGATTSQTTHATRGSE